ncbi:hypothetical protein ECAD30_45820 [Escherichia coli AD30]|nr:hypothetical protein ECAD30_45820 [Escherichia coli AD30]
MPAFTDGSQWPSARLGCGSPSDDRFEHEAPNLLWQMDF